MENDPGTVEATVVDTTEEFWNKAEVFTLRLHDAQSNGEANATRDEATRVLTAELRQSIGNSSCFGVIGDTYLATKVAESSHGANLSVTWGTFSGVSFKRLPPGSHGNEKLAISLIDLVDGKPYVAPLSKDTIMMIDASSSSTQSFESIEESSTTELAIWGNFFHLMLTRPSFLKKDKKQQRDQVVKMQNILDEEIAHTVPKGKELFVQVKRDSLHDASDKSEKPPQSEYFVSSSWRCVVPEFETYSFHATDRADYQISDGVPCLEITDVDDDETKYTIPLTAIVNYGQFAPDIPDTVAEVELSDIDEASIYRHIADYMNDEDFAGYIRQTEERLITVDEDDFDTINAEVDSLNDILDQNLTILPTYFDGTVLRENHGDRSFFSVPLLCTECTFCGFDVIQIDGRSVVAFALEVPQSCFTHTENEEEDVPTEIVYVPALANTWRSFLVYENEADEVVTEPSIVDDLKETALAVQHIIGTRDFKSSTPEQQLSLLDAICSKMNGSIRIFQPSENSDTERVIEVAGGMYWSIPLAFYGSLDLMSVASSMNQVGQHSSEWSSPTGDDLRVVMPEIEAAENPTVGNLDFPISDGIPMLRLIDSETQMVYLFEIKSILSITINEQKESD